MKEAGKGVNDYETGGIDHEKESLLHGREEDHSKGADAPFRGLPAAEGVRIHQFMEQPGTRQFVRPWIH